MSTCASKPEQEKGRRVAQSPHMTWQERGRFGLRPCRRGTVMAFRLLAAPSYQAPSFDSERQSTRGVVVEAAQHGVSATLRRACCSESQPQAVISTKFRKRSGACELTGSARSVYNFTGIEVRCSIRVFRDRRAPR